ncbi:MAG: hypothetical protein ABEJ92_07420 [Halobacteriales archaeon]
MDAFLPVPDPLLEAAGPAVGLLATALGSVDRDLLVRAAIAALGSGFVAYGLREFLRAFGGGYYCCNHAYYAAVGLGIAGVGWVGVLLALRGPTPE